MHLLKFKSLFSQYLWPSQALEQRSSTPLPESTPHGGSTFSTLLTPASALSSVHTHRCGSCSSSDLSFDQLEWFNPAPNVEALDMPSRRLFLQSLCASALLLSLPGFAQAETTDFWSQPRRLRLYRPQLNQTIDTVYWANGQLQWDGYRQICYLFQDHRQKAAATIDVKLLDLLCAMQAWTAYYGFDDPIQLNSGYRTQATNRILEGAALNSMHLYGRAADVVFKGLPVAYIGRLAQHYSGGGVGFYPQSGFVHVDTGRIRTWGKR